MISAALDTSHGGALAIADDSRLLFCGALALHGRDNDRELLPWVRAGLAQAGVTPDAIRRWTVGTGPGSFSGVRTGIALVKGICAVTGASYRGVPSSVALARGLDLPPAALRVGVLHDGRCGQVILSRFRWSGACLSPEGEPSAEEPDALAAPDRRCDRYATVQPDQVFPVLPPVVRERAVSLVAVEARHLLDVTGWPWPTDAAGMEASAEPIYVRPPVFVAPRLPRNTP